MRRAVRQMRASWNALPTEDRLLWSLGAGALFLGSFIVGRWWGRDDLVFEALQTMFALAAFLAAAAAVKATWPQYRAWRAAPVIRLWIEVANSESDVPHRVVGGTAEYSEGSFIVLIVIENTGQGTMRAALVNLLAPLTCDLRPLDPDKTHYVAPLPSRSVELLDENGNAAPARSTVARDEITAGRHVFHVMVTPKPGVDSVPIIANVSGDPMPPESERQRHVLFTPRRDDGATERPRDR